jgi:hypothetical protein
VAAILILFTLEASSMVLLFARERAARRAEEDRLRLSPIPDVWWRGNLGEAIRRPATVEAKDAKIRSDEIVIGVAVDGKTRAYRLAAFGEPRGHLVNDMIGGTAVSVAYCNLTDCARAYTSSRASAPLDLEIAGLLNGEMIVKINGTLYFQKSGGPVEPGKAAHMPYEALTPIRTTYGEWVRNHPRTEVYVGDGREFPATKAG